MTVENTGALAGLRVFLSRESDSPMARALEAAGAQVAATPLCLYTARPQSDLAPSVERLARGEYSWLCLTSPRTLAMISEAGFDVPGVLSAAVTAGTRIAVVGPATAVSVFDAGQRAHLTAGDPPSSAALVKSFSRFVVTNDKPILIPCASIAKKTLPEGLGALGWQVEVLHVYDTDAASELPEVMSTAFEATQSPDANLIDIFFVTSGSVARAASALLEKNGIERPSAVALGEPSASMLRQLDWDTYGICPSAQMPDIIDTLAKAGEQIKAATR
ncbi:MAG: uroporphyrinogen-III synthase [Actinomycetaceae bacterium]|nr:uroporphyrinogen-III synthase [Actinomycetaceae bacterium]